MNMNTKNMNCYLKFDIPVCSKNTYKEDDLKKKLIGFFVT